MPPNSASWSRHRSVVCDVEHEWGDDPDEGDHQEDKENRRPEKPASASSRKYRGARHTSGPKQRNDQSEEKVRDQGPYRFSVVHVLANDPHV